MALLCALALAQWSLTFDAAAAAGEQGFKEDAAHLLFDEARLLEGDRLADAKLFSDRLARVLERSLRSS